MPQNRGKRNNSLNSKNQKYNNRNKKGSKGSSLTLHKPQKSTVLKLLISVTFISIILVALGTIYLTYISSTLPSWDETAFDQSMTSKIYDKDDTVVSMKYQNFNRIPVPYNQISPAFLTAIVATEDKDFYKHKGFSITGIIRSTITNIFTTGRPLGASTITQQLARGVLLANEDTTSVSYVRKIKEILLAMQIEERLTKEEILKNYVNSISYGQGAYGIEAAAITYFNKSAKDLSISEAAMLAGMPQAPSYYNPFENMEAAKIRRDQVIDRLVAVKYITKDEAKKLKEEPITLNHGVPNQAVNEAKDLANYQYFIDYVTIEAEKIISSKNLESLYSGGYKVYTTLDTNVQAAMETVYNNDANFPSGMNGIEPESAMAVIDPKTGAIRGLVGGRTYSVELGFNRAVSAKRQPGSVFKPLAVYGPAFEKGLISPSTIVKDTPEPPLPDGKGGNYKLVNYSEGYSGNVSIRTAVMNSINTVAVRILYEITPKYGYEFAKRLGVTSLTEGDQNNLALALGGLEIGVSPLEMARAFGVFANGGTLNESTCIRRIEDNYGNVIYESKPASTQVISPEVAYMITSVLLDVVNSGTGKAAALKTREVAGKTGTTDLVVNGTEIPEGNGDLWFVGYTPQLSGAVWIGYDNNSLDAYLNKKQYGSSMAADIWSSVMSLATAMMAAEDFKRPSGIIDLQTDPSTGLPTSANTGIIDIFINGLLPSKPSSTLSLPTGGKATKNGNQVVLSWDNNNNAECTIYRIDQNGQEAEIGKTNSNSFTDNDGGAAKAYKIKSADGEIIINL